MQAKDIPEQILLETIGRLSMEQGSWGRIPHWVLIRDLTKALPQFPERVMLAKLKRMISRRLLGGCTCGCRGDFELTALGWERLREEK